MPLSKNEKSHNKQPVIMQIIPHLGAGGAEQGCIDMAGEIVKAGAKSIVVSNGGHRSHEIKRRGAEHIQMPVHSKNPIIMWRNISRIKKLIKKHDVDIVHVRSRAPAWSAYIACEKTNTHYITTCHAPYNISGDWKRTYNSSIIKAEKVIAISHYVENYLLREYDIDKDRIEVIHRGIPIDKFSPSAVTPQRMITVSQKWRIPESARIVMLPGRLTRWKGHEYFIKAMAQIKKDDVYGIIIGSDQGRTEYSKELNDLIKEHHLEQNIRIVDHCDDMPAAYMCANVAVCASTDPEGFGRIPVESQAMGRPIVATDHGGAQETIIRGHTGWLIPPADENAMAIAIQEALDLDEEQRLILAQRAMENVMTNFSKDVMAEKTLNLYAQILKSDFATQAA